MKTNLLKKFSLVLLLNSSLFAIENGIYLELGAGAGYEDSMQVEETTYTYDRDYILNAIIGYQYELYRVELETRYKTDSLYSAEVLDGSHILTSGDFTQTTEMINAYYSGYNSTKFVTSVGGGLGVTTKELQNTLKSSNIFSAQALLSVGYRVTEKFVLSAKYSFFYTEKSGAFKSDNENIFLFSARYIF
jgi:hypothetical protein